MRNSQKLQSQGIYKSALSRLNTTGHGQGSGPPRHRSPQAQRGRGARRDVRRAASRPTEVPTVTNRSRVCIAGLVGRVLVLVARVSGLDEGELAVGKDDLIPVFVDVVERAGGVCDLRRTTEPVSRASRGARSLPATGASTPGAPRRAAAPSATPTGSVRGRAYSAFARISVSARPATPNLPRSAVPAGG